MKLNLKHFKHPIQVHGLSSKGKGYLGCKIPILIHPDKLMMVDWIGLVFMRALIKYLEEEKQYSVPLKFQNPRTKKIVNFVMINIFDILKNLTF